MFLIKQAADKGPKKQAPKVKPPDINDAEFPGLPGMIIKPKAEDTPAPAEAEGDGDVEKANGDAGEEEEKALCDKPEVSKGSHFLFFQGGGVLGFFKGEMRKANAEFERFDGLWIDWCFLC